MCKNELSIYKLSWERHRSRLTTIHKFPFSSDGNATDVGDLLAINSSAAGQQV